MTHVEYKAVAAVGKLVGLDVKIGDVIVSLAELAPYAPVYFMKSAFSYMLRRGCKSTPPSRHINHNAIICKTEAHNKCLGGSHDASLAQKQCHNHDGVRLAS